MKNKIIKLILIFLISLLFSISKSYGQLIIADSLECLEIAGKISNIGSKQGDIYRVELIYFNTVVHDDFISTAKCFKYNLKKDAIYSIRISKKGYITKLISIYTKLPEKNDEFFKLDFETELIEEHKSKKLNADALDFPITIIYYDEIANWFYFNEEYTSNIKRCIYDVKVVRNKI